MNFDQVTANGVNSNNRETDCMSFPCFFLADGKGVCYTVFYE